MPVFTEQEVKMGVITEKYYDRLNQRWAHPELSGFYETFNAPDPIGSQQFDSSVPFEERKKINAAAREGFAAAFGEMPDPENVSHYEVKGEVEKPLKVSIAMPSEPQEKMPLLFIFV